MKILHLLQSDHFSGAENVVCQIIKMFEDDKRIEMCYCSPDGTIREALKERGVRFCPLEDLNVSSLKKVLKIEIPDIIHAHDMGASFLAARACTTEKLVSHIHNNSFDNRRLSAKSIAYLLPAIKSKHIIYVSNSAYKGYLFHNLFKSKSSVIYNVISISDILERVKIDNNHYDYDVIFLGRLSEPKNPVRLIGVINKAVSLKKDLRVAIVGTGELEDITKEKCKEYGLGDNIDYLGFQSNPSKILQDSKCMIMTSLWEGTPMCALEAIALGVPIVSTPTDGLKELVVHGETGYLSDNDDELAHHIVEIATNPVLHEELKQRTRTRSYVLNDINSYKQTILEIYG